jgi:hypothetical protein
VLVDGFVSDSFVRCFVDLILHSSQGKGGLQFAASGKRSALDGISCSQWSIARSTVEQSNTSVRVGCQLLPFRDEFCLDFVQARGFGALAK